jgi:hypothetical protein
MLFIFQFDRMSSIKNKVRKYFCFTNRAGRENMKNKTILIVLIFIFLTSLSTVALAAQGTKIGSGSEPAIDSSKAAWSDNGVIHIYDLTTRKDTIEDFDKPQFFAGCL